MITQAYLHRLLRYEPTTGVFTWKVNRRGHTRAGMRAGYLRPSGYRCIKIQKKNYLEHRLAWFYVHGVWPDILDHINRDISNSAMLELRLATPTQNQRNMKKRKDNSSGFKGVSWHRQRQHWVARIKAGSKNIYLGSFNSPQQAHAAYVAAAKRYFGAFARVT